MKLFNPLCARLSALSPRRINEEELNSKYITKLGVFIIMMNRLGF
jgi:hypothetical protein